MTREDVIEIFERFVIGSKPCSQREIVDACASAYRMLKEQPSLPSDLNEAAEKNFETMEVLEHENIFEETHRKIFKAGAEWMARQGFISEGIINQTSGEDTIIELNEHIGYLEDCEEVIVNIRKKQ